MEDLLLSHPGVGDVAVIGVADERAGELPRALVVRKPRLQPPVTEEELQNFVAGASSSSSFVVVVIVVVFRLSSSSSFVVVALTSLDKGVGETAKIRRVQ